jgi:hypothetical protein
MMVYNTQNLGFWTLSIIWYFKEHNVSETGSVSSSGEGETPTLLGSLERANFIHWSMLGPVIEVSSF